MNLFPTSRKDDLPNQFDQKSSPNPQPGVAEINLSRIKKSVADKAKELSLTEDARQLAYQEITGNEGFLNFVVKWTTGAIEQEDNRAAVLTKHSDEIRSELGQLRRLEKDLTTPLLFPAGSEAKLDGEVALTLKTRYEKLISNSGKAEAQRTIELKRLAEEKDQVLETAGNIETGLAVAKNVAATTVTFGTALATGGATGLLLGTGAGTLVRTAEETGQELASQSAPITAGSVLDGIAGNAPEAFQTSTIEAASTLAAVKMARLFAASSALLRGAAGGAGYTLTTSSLDAADKVYQGTETRSASQIAKEVFGQAIGGAVLGAVGAKSAQLVSGLWKGNWGQKTLRTLAEATAVAGSVAGVAVGEAKIRGDEVSNQALGQMIAGNIASYFVGRKVALGRQHVPQDGTQEHLHRGLNLVPEHSLSRTLIGPQPGNDAVFSPEPLQVPLRLVASALALNVQTPAHRVQPTPLLPQLSLVQNTGGIQASAKPDGASNSNGAIPDGENGGQIDAFRGAPLAAGNSTRATTSGNAEKTDSRLGSWPDGRSRVALPVDEKWSELRQLLQQNQVIVLQGQTGSGKSTRVPQMLLFDDLIQGNPHAKVYLLQPRRAAVRGITARIADELGESVGQTAGYTLAREPARTSQQTRIVTQIDESFLNSLKGKGEKLPEGIIIVDEADVRSLAIDELLGVLKLRLPHNPQTKLIVTSATLDAGKMVSFFGGAPTLEVSGRVFPIKKIDRPLERYEHHSQAAISTATGFLKSFGRNDALRGVIHPKLLGDSKAELSQTEIDQAFQLPESSTVMMVLPGKEDIRLAAQSLAREAERLGLEDRIEILEVHGDSSPEVQLQVQRQRVPQGKIRFVVGTEVIARSITAQGVVAVIDSGERKRNVVTSVGIPRLEKQPASQAELEQSAGRAGRIKPGIAITVRDMYGRQPPLFPTPEIMTAPLETTVLRIASLGEKVDTFPFIDAPPENSVKLARERLIRLGAIDDQGNITLLGKKLLEIPLPPGLAMSVLAAAETGTLGETIIATAAIAGERVFNRPFQDSKLTIPDDLARSLYENANTRSLSRWDTTNPEKISWPPAELPSWLHAVKNDEYSVNIEDFPGGRDSYARLTRLYFANMSPSANAAGDFSAIVNAIRSFNAERKKLETSVSRSMKSNSKKEIRFGEIKEAVSRKLTEWCNAHCLDRRKVEEILGVIPEIVEPVRRTGIAIDDPLRPRLDYDGAQLVRSLVPGQMDHLAVLSGQDGYLSQLGPVSVSHGSLASRNFPIILTNRPNNVPTKGRGRNFLLIADLAAPIGIEDLKQSMPHLFSERRLHDARYLPDQDAVSQTREAFFLGLKVHSEGTTDVAPLEKSAAIVDWLASNPSVDQAKKVPPPVQRVLAFNRQGLSRGSELNIRAGEPIFPVDDTSLRRELLRPGVGERGSFAEIMDGKAWTKLRLPGLDRDLARQVIRGNPSYINVAGARRKVSYNLNSPLATISEREMASGVWKSLPDEVLLPGGRAVQFFAYFQLNNYHFNVGPLPASAFKEAVAGKHADAAFQRYLNERPNFMAADPISGPVTPEIISKIVPFQYGNDVRNGEPLYAYQAVAFEGGAYRQKLFPNLLAAEKARSGAEDNHGRQWAEKARNQMTQQASELLREAEQTLGRSANLMPLKGLFGRLGYHLGVGEARDLQSQLKEIEQQLRVKMEQKSIERRREEDEAQAMFKYQRAVEQLGEMEPISAINVRPDGTVAVFCGHSGSEDPRELEASPAYGGRTSGPALLAGNHMGIWQDIPTNRVVKISYNSERQRGRHQVQFTIPKSAIKTELPPGVYVLARRQGAAEGVSLYPSSFREGVANEVVSIPTPEQVKVISLRDLETRFPRQDNAVLFTERSDRYFLCNTCDGTARLTKSEYREYKAGKPTEIGCPHCSTKSVLLLTTGDGVVAENAASTQSTMNRKLEELANRFKR